MNYRLHHQGSDLGEFSLEELRRRRETGQLSGAEYVWREGMSDWATLDSILQQPVPPAPRPVSPPPIPTSALKSRSNHAVLWIAVGCVAALVFISLLGVVGAKVGARLFPFYRFPVAANRDDSLAIASKPVVTTPKTITEKEARQKGKEFRIRQWVGGYNQNAKHDQPCDAEAVQFLETWLGRTYGGDVATNLPSNAQWAEKFAAQRDCDDPLLMAAVANCTAGFRERTNRFERALENFIDSTHKGYPKFYTAVMLARELRDPSRIEQLDGLAVGYFKQAMNDGSFQSEDQPVLGEILVNEWAYNFFNRNRDSVCRIVDDSGSSFHWLSLVLNGERHIIEAWKLRGGGYANSVTETGWRGFSTHLASARKALTQAWRLRPDLPLAPERMIYVSLGGANLAEMRNWFDRTVIAQVDYPRAWSDLRWGLRPRWYGSPQSMLAFGCTALDTKRFDTDVPRKFFDAVSDIESEEEVQPGRHIYGRPDIWPHLQAMYEGYLGEPSQAGQRDGWRSSFFAVAYCAGKYDVARAQLDALNWKPLPNNLTGWGADMTFAADEVAARTGSAGLQVASAEDAAGRDDIAKAISIYSLLPSLNLDEHAARFVRLRLAALDRDRRLQNGEWLEFLPESDSDPLWTISRGEIQYLTNGAVEVNCASDGHFLFCHTRIGVEFEIRGEFDVGTSSADSFQAGLVMGSPNLNDRNWYAFRLIRNARGREFARLSRGWAQPEIDKPVSLNDAGNSFDLQFEKGKFTAVVNGQKVFDQVAPPQEISVSAENFLGGFGAFNSRAAHTVVYRKVQIKKLAPKQTSTADSR